MYHSLTIDPKPCEFFTFSSFEELKGFLKGKIVYNCNALTIQILESLGFENPYNISEDGLGIDVNNTTITRRLAMELSYDKISSEAVENWYFDLKEMLVYSIIPWPLTISEARNITLLELENLRKLATQIIQATCPSTYWEEIVSIDLLKELIVNYETQIDNLKYLI